MTADHEEYHRVGCSAQCLLLLNKSFLSFTPVEELPQGDDRLTTSPNAEDLVSPVPTRVHPVQAKKCSTQRQKTTHHSPQPPICHPSTSAVPATGDYSCDCCYFISNTKHICKYSVFLFSYKCYMFLNKRMAHQDQRQGLPAQTAEVMVIDGHCQVHFFQ